MYTFHACIRVILVLSMAQLYFTKGFYCSENVDFPP